MSSLQNILNTMTPAADDATWTGNIPDDWLQGRTSYGGLSAAIALHAAMRSEPDLPPLRSAQVSFVGPLAGPVTVRTERLRRGKNAAFIHADVIGENGLGTRATFVFMRAIESEIDREDTPAPDFPRPGPDDQTFKGNPHVAFTRQFEFLDRRDGPNLKPAEWLRWTRLNERAGLDPMVELIAVADCLPPAALRILGRNVPMSSLTWILNVLGPQPATTDGWWLLRSDADYARAGSSSQVMGVWNADGVKVAEQMQSVAIFG